MIQFIKKKSLILLIIMSVMIIPSFANTYQDSTVLITAQQLKKTNLIFLEHKKLLNENKLLYQQINNYKLDNLTLNQIDSLKTLQLSEYKTKVNILNQEIAKKNKSILLLKIGGVSVSIGLLLVLLLK